MTLPDVAVVTGGAGAIGSAIVNRLHASGYEPFVLDSRNGYDVTDERDVGAAFKAASATGPIKAVVMAAGVVSRGPVETLGVDEWRRVLDINLTGSFLCAREAARLITDGGSIVFLASQAGRKGAAGWSAYSASKFGVIGLMESLAQELAPREVRCNAICPGSVASPMLDASADDGAALLRGIPFRRFARPDEVADIAAFLCSPSASYVSGASIVVDGAELS